MKTERLIDMLARQAGPAPRAVLARRLVPVLLGGLAVSAWLASWALGTIPVDLFSTPIPWMKLLYAGSLAGAACWCVSKLSRPLSRLSMPMCLTALVVLVMLVMGIRGWMATPATQRMPELMGHSWFVCPWIVYALSLPTLLGVLWAVRGLAPARPRAAGLLAGLLAGATGAFVYAFSCPEPAVTFVAAWYTLGIFLTGLLGAALGPRVLRW